MTSPMQSPVHTATSADTHRAVERLTAVHMVHLDGREYECEPLLEQLRQAITASLGKGSSTVGTSADGGLINVAAHDLYETIDGWARAWLQDWKRDHRGDLLSIITNMPAMIQAEHANGLITDDMRERLDAWFGQWVAKIEDLFDPPHQKELTAACPECGERYMIREERDDEGNVVETTRHGAVVIPVKRGRAVIAECRCCGSMWATESGLIELADAMGIEVDFVALRELVTEGAS